MTAVSQRQRNILIHLCLALVTAAVYWPVGHFEFANFDDPLYVAENRHLQDGLTPRGVAWAFTTPLDQWMPVTWLARILEYQWFGLNPGAHHLVNVLFHVVNTLLLFGVLNRMTGFPWRSALVAALFALHPLHVESVAWVTGLKDVLSTCFWLLTIWAYGRYTEQFTVQPFDKLRAGSSQFSVHGSGFEAQRSLVRRSLGEGGTLHAFYALSLVFFALGLMSKPMVVTLPFVLLLLDFWPLGRTPWAGSVVGDKAKRPVGQLLKEKLPFLVLAAGSCVVTLWAQSSVGMVVSLGRLPPEERIANALLSYLGYLGKVFWPAGLTVYYPPRPGFPASAVMGAAVALAGATVAAIWQARRKPWLVTGWFWYLGTLVPVIGLIQVGRQAMADRYTYVPLVGLFVMLCWSVPASVFDRRMSRAIACVGAGTVLAACALLTRIQLAYWKNSETLFRHALNVTRDNWVAHDSLGNALQQAGKVQEAISHYEQALRIEPDYVQGHNNLGVALWQLGRSREARTHWERVLRIKPDHVDAQNNLAWLMATLAPPEGGDPVRALTIAQRVCKLTDNRVATHLDTLAVAYAATGRFSDAVATAQKAIALARTAGQPGLVREIESRLQLYRDGRPYHQPPSPVRGQPVGVTSSHTP